MRWLGGLVAVAYPLLVFAGLRWLEPRTLAVGLALLFVARSLPRALSLSADALRKLLAPAVGVGAVLATTLVSNDPRFLMFVPAGVSAALLVAFSRSLVRGPPWIETFARMQHPDLDEAEVRHCRRVTWIWCGFFALNAAVSFGLALAGWVGWWTLYTGGIAYAGMGVLFVGEFVYRAWRFRRYQGSALEPVLRRLFPDDQVSSRQ